MTTSGVNPGSGPLNALAALGQQQSRDGSGKHAGLDFAGLLSRLSAAVEPGSDAKSDQAQPLVAGAAVNTLAAQRNLPSSGSSIALVKDPQRNLDGEDKSIVQAEAEASITVADDVAIGVEGSKDDDLLQALHIETAPATDNATSRDGSATTAPIVPAQGQPEEIQALLSSVMRSAPDTFGNLPRTSAKTSAQAAVPAQGARAKVVGETTGATAQSTGNAQGVEAPLPVDTAWQEPVQVSLDRLADTMMPRARDQSTASAPAADLKLAVLQTETHHAPILHGGPMAQIAEGIRSELAAGGETALTWSPSASASAKPHADAPVKVLLIQLQPADLGTVTIRMSLKENALELHIETSQQDTAQRLQQDQDSLSKVLRSAGYLIDGVAIRAADPDRSLVPPSQISASLSQSSHEQTAGGAPSEGGTFQGRGHHEQAARGQGRQGAPAESGGQRPSSSGGLFV
jgi:flagellar hook-length control protein FliK